MLWLRKPRALFWSLTAAQVEPSPMWIWRIQTKAWPRGQHVDNVGEDEIGFGPCAGHRPQPANAGLASLGIPQNLNVVPQYTSSMRHKNSRLA
jgi:hypothetical protein